MKLEKSCRKNRGKIKVVFGVIASLTCLYLFSLSGIQAKEPGAASSSSRGLKVGVVDLNNVFEKYEKRKASDAQLKEQEKQYQKIINDKKKDLVSLNEKIQLLDLGSEVRKRTKKPLKKRIWSWNPTRNLLRRVS